MIKTEELRKESTEALNKRLKEIEYQQIKASSVWGKELASQKAAGIYVKGTAKQGSKTSIQKNLRRVRAKILTILNERKKTGINN